MYSTKTAELKGQKIMKRMKFDTKYQEYAYKFMQRASELQSKHKRAYMSLPRMYSESEFKREYNERKDMYGLLAYKNTNYMRDIISDQFKTTDSYTNAILKAQENKITKMMAEEGISRTQAIKIFKANDYYLTKSDIKYQTEAYWKRYQDEIRDYYYMLRNQGFTTEDAAHMIGVEFFGS